VAIKSLSILQVKIYEESTWLLSECIS